MNLGKYLGGFLLLVLGIYLGFMGYGLVDNLGAVPLMNQSEPNMNDALSWDINILDSDITFTNCSWSSDPNDVIFSAYDSTVTPLEWIDLPIDYIDIMLTTGSGCDAIITFDGVLDIECDPNCMTQVAWVFFDEYLRDIVDLYIRDNR